MEDNCKATQRLATGLLVTLLVGLASTACGAEANPPHEASAEVLAKLASIERRLDAIERELGEQIRPSGPTRGRADLSHGKIGALASIAARGPAPERRLVLHLSTAGLYHDDILLSEVELAELVSTAVRLHDDPSATLLADDDVEHAHVARTLDTIRRAGIEHFSFATRTPAGDDEPTSSSR